MQKNETGPVGALLERVGVARAEVIEPARTPEQELAQLSGVDAWLGWLQSRCVLIAREQKLIDAARVQLQDAARQTDPLKATRYLAQLAHIRTEIEALRNEPPSLRVSLRTDAGNEQGGIP